MKKNKSSIILGINPAHNAAAALMVDGKIVAAVQEERFSRIKNHIGLPVKSIEFVLASAGIDIGRLTDVVICGRLQTFFYLSTLSHAGYSAPKKLIYGNAVFLFLRYQVLHKLAKWLPILGEIDFWITWFLDRIINPLTRRRVMAILTREWGINPDIVTFCEHHGAHASMAYFASSDSDFFKKTLVFTADGGGDELAATVWMGERGRLRLIAATPITTALAYIYMYTTHYLGLTPVEDEYKVMGLAPYAKQNKVEEIYSKLSRFIWVDKKTLQFNSSVNTNVFHTYLPSIYYRKRFDAICGAVQKLIEELVCDWIDAACSKHKVNSIVAGGGLFANVKMNQKIASLGTVKSAFFAPSPGDESNSIGACYLRFRQLHPRGISEPLANLYLGPRAGLLEVKETLKLAKAKGFIVSQPKRINLRVAQLIAKGEVVARLSGALEFGSRALGNRSILADASRIEVKDLLNRIIKNRDFWMPFAPSIIESHHKRYLINPKNLRSPFMTITFDTTELGEKDLAAAVHPYDKTARAQLVSREENPDFFDLLMSFYNLSGKSGVLNTSFNLHGEPIVCTPADALSTFERSGLRFLQLESYLIGKKVKY